MLRLNINTASAKFSNPSYVIDRVKKNLPRTNNNLENWYMQIQSDVRIHLTVPKGSSTI